VSKISKRRKDGRSQRLPLANNLPANNAADGGWAEHGAHNGRGRPYRQGFGVKGLARQCRFSSDLPPPAFYRAMFGGVGGTRNPTNNSRRQLGWAGTAQSRTNRTRNSRPAEASGAPRILCSHRGIGTRPSAWFPSPDVHTLDRSVSIP
jgi:hypothetical protein